MRATALQPGGTRPLTAVLPPEPRPGKSSPAFRRLFGPTATWVSIGILVVAAIHPPHGAGIPICGWRAITGLPCPGCGLTRSVSCTVRGELAAAWAYHPFGPVLLALAAGSAVAGLQPRRVRQRLAGWCDRHGRALTISYAMLISAFLLFGVLRGIGVFWAGLGQGGAP